MAVVSVADTFTRADSPSLGVTHEGAKTWVRAAGTAGISGGRAELTNAVAYVDAEVQDVDVRADLTDGGFVAFRVVDGDDYWRARHEARVVNTGTTAITGVEYEWRAEYGGVQTGGHHASGGNSHSTVTRTAWGTQTTDPTPVSTLSLSHTHTGGSGSALHSLTKLSSSRTGASRTTTTGYQTTYRTDRYVHLEVVRGGVVQLYKSALLPAGTTTVRVGVVNLRRGEISVQANQVEVMTLVSSEMLGSTRAGIGSSGLAYADTFTLTPLEVPPPVPTQLRPDGTTVAVGHAPMFVWAHNGATAQSRYVLRVRKVGSAAWSTFDETTDVQARTFPATFLSAGNWEWDVVTYSQAGLASPVSKRALFTAEEPPGTPTVTAPAIGATVGKPEVTLTWTATAFDSYQVFSIADGVRVYDSGIVVSAVSQHVVPLPVNNRSETLWVRVRRNGLWSAFGAVPINVSYVPPPPGDHEVDRSGPWIRVMVRNRTPSGNQPAALSNELYRRRAGSADAVGVRVASGLPVNGEWLDPHAGHRADVEYAVVAVGQADTRSPHGPWVPLEPVVVTPDDGTSDKWVTGSDLWATGGSEWVAVPEPTTQGGHYGTSYGPSY